MSMLGRPSRTLAAAAISLGMTAAGLAAATAPALAADPDVSLTLCPAGTPSGDPQPVWVGDSLPADTAVTGRTTIRGTTPTDFTGTYLDTIADSFGNEIYVFELAGSRVTKANGDVDAGIWSGMSGSPVYDADGTLIGAVAYSFTGTQASNLAGVTPAADLFAMDTDPVDDSVDLTRREAAAFGAPQGAELTRMSAARVLASSLGAKSVDDAKRYRNFAPKRLGRDTPAGAGTTAIAEPLVAGSNVAASWTSGALTYASVGTVTAVCGAKVFAFGHPDENVGESRQTLHQASAVSVVADGAESFKMVNVDPEPVGAVVFDGNHGIYARTDRAAAPAVPVQTTSTLNGEQISHTTQVSVAGEALTETVGNQVFSQLAAQLKAGLRGADVTTTYAITYTSNGSAPRKLTRTKRYTTPAGTAAAVAGDLASIVDTMQSATVDDVAITGVRVDSVINKTTYNAWKLVGTQYTTYSSKPGTYKTAPASGITVKKGQKLSYRFVLKSPASPTPVYIWGPGVATRSDYGSTGRITARSAGFLAEDEEVGFDDEGYYYGFYEDEEDEPLTLADLVTLLKTEADGTEFTTRIAYSRSGRSGGITGVRSTPSKVVVTGAQTVPVKFVR